MARRDRAVGELETSSAVALLGQGLMAPRGCSGVLGRGQGGGRPQGPDKSFY